MLSKGAVNVDIMRELPKALIDKYKIKGASKFLYKS